MFRSKFIKDTDEIPGDVMKLGAHAHASLSALQSAVRHKALAPIMREVEDGERKDTGQPDAECQNESVDPRPLFEMENYTLHYTCAAWNYHELTDSELRSANI